MENKNRTRVCGIVSVVLAALSIIFIILIEMGSLIPYVLQLIFGFWFFIFLTSAGIVAIVGLVKPVKDKKGIILNIVSLSYFVIISLSFIISTTASHIRQKKLDAAIAARQEMEREAKEELEEEKPVYVEGYQFNFPQTSLSDFEEVEEVRDNLHTNNYTYPRVQRVSEKYIGMYNQDLSDPIYIALYIMENIGKKYVSQELFSEIVQALMNCPQDLYEDYYAKIYVAGNMQISHLLAFAKNDMGQIKIDIYNPKGRDSILLEVESIRSSIQVSYKILESSYDSLSVRIPRSFVKLVWYALWDFQWDNESASDFEMSDEEVQAYDYIYKSISALSDEEFRDSYQLIPFMEELFEQYYGKPSVLERMALTELARRALMAGM
ncbi:MAG: hypothetical protein K6C97_08350 [Treponema sp.]|nr:hypothetical protein [Treponema sp.]